MTPSLSTWSTLMVSSDDIRIRNTAANTGEDAGDWQEPVARQEVIRDAGTVVGPERIAEDPDRGLGRVAGRGR
jgi:hypothetical protein